MLPGDTMFVYGKVSRVAEIDGREAGASGDLAHRRAVAEHIENDRFESTRDATEMMGPAKMRRD